MSAGLDPGRRARIRAGAVGALMALPERIGRYEIRGELGRGGMGIVYDAWDPELARAVAIKVVRPDRLESDPSQGSAGVGSLERFEREMRATSGLFHRNLVAILDAGVDEIDGERRPFYVMERVDGESLDERLGRCGAWTHDAALDLVLAVARGLSAAHGRGLVHRDLKPSNVLLPWAGEPRVTDFGLCLSARDPETRAGEIVGSAHYLAPEQVVDAAVDARADLFSLGAILIQVHTGSPPFSAPSWTAHLDRIVGAAPDGLDRLPPDLRPLAERLVAKDPRERPADAQAVVAELLAVKAGRHAPAARRRRTRIAVVWACAALALALCLLVTVRARREITRLDLEVAQRRQQLEIQMARARDLLPVLERLGEPGDEVDREQRLGLRDEVAGIVNRIALERRRYAAAIAERERRRAALSWLGLGGADGVDPAAAASDPAMGEPERSGSEGIFSPEERAHLERQLELLERELGVEARLWIEPWPSGRRIEARARDRFARLAREDDARWERGLLIWIDGARGDARIEVGYALEPVLPDALLGSLLRDVALASQASGDRELAWRLALRVIRQRLRQAMLHGDLPRVGPAPLLADAGGGAGATHPASEPVVARPAPLSAQERAAFGPGETPADAIEHYRSWLARGRFDAHVDVLTPESQALLADWPATPAYRRHLLAEQPSGRVEILVRGSAAMVVPADDPLATPQLLARGPDGWRVDLAAEQRHVLHIAGGATAWSLRDIEAAPLDRFEDELVVVDGFIRLRSGDNRALVEGLLAASPPFGGRDS